MQIMNVQQCGFSQKKTYVKIILSALVLIFFLCETKNIFLCLQEKWKLILLVKSCRRRSPAMILRPRYPNVCGEKSKQKLVISTRPGNKSSRIFHNHGEGPYQIFVNPKIIIRDRQFGQHRFLKPPIRHVLYTRVPNSNLLTMFL